MSGRNARPSTAKKPEPATSRRSTAQCSNMRASAPGGGYGTGTFGWVATLSRRPGALSAEVHCGILLHAWSGNYAIGMSSGLITRGQAVARLSLCAPCRPDIARAALDDVRAYRARDFDPQYDAPPLAAVLDLLSTTVGVCAGEMPLMDGAGHVVRHVTERHKERVRRALEVSGAGVEIVAVTTVEQLAALGLVDTEHLTAEPPLPEGAV